MAFSIETVCRLNGTMPTPRERWIAFYRLWRMSHTGDIWNDNDASDCFRILFSGKARDLIVLLGTDRKGNLDRSHWPKFLRKRILESEKRRRLYAGHWEWMDRDKVIAAKLHSEGTEVTPTEVAELRRKIINHVRQQAVTDGIRIPQDDNELLAWLKEAHES